MSMRPPVARCDLDKGRLTITVEPGSFAGDWFALIADALKNEAIGLSGPAYDDAVYLESIADAVADAVRKGEAQRQKRIADIFG